MKTRFIPHPVRTILVTILIFGLTGLLVAGSGCTQQAPIQITVAEQYGLAYAPIQVMKEMGYLESALTQRADGRPVQVHWIKLANTAAIQEAMVADALDVAFVGIPPFLIGRDQGMPWSIMTGLTECPVELLCNDPTILDLSALVGQGKIALPQPGSIQHILLAMAAEKQLGDATVFDRQLVSMKHPDGLQALLAGSDVVAQFTSPPYNFIAAEDQGIHTLLSGQRAMGEPFSFIVGIAEEPFLKDDLRREAFLDALDQSMTLIRNEPDQTVALLSDYFELSPAKTKDYLYDRGMVFSSDIHGVATFSEFMLRNGYLERHTNAQDLVWTSP